MNTATIYAHDGAWIKIAKYPMNTAIAAMNDPDYRRHIENSGFSAGCKIAAINDETGEIIKEV